MSLENRKMLALAAPPSMTTDVSAFADTVEDAIVRVDDQSRLIIRTTGEDNEIRFRLEFGYLQVNAADYSSLALEIDPTQYDRILLLSGGNDSVEFYGSNLQAQMRPDLLWVRSQSVGNLVGDSKTMEIHGSNFESLTVSEDSTRDVGPFFLTSNNEIRMYGSDGVDRLRMQSKNSFAISTGVEMVGEGYRFVSNAFGDLYVSGGGGEDFATLKGTRGFSQDAFFFLNAPNGQDLYYGRDNFSRISNDLWDGRFVDFETQRVDLLSGDDQSIVEDILRPETWYRVDGNDLVGAFRRMVNVETIEVNGNDSVDSLFRPQREGTLTELQNRFVFAADFERDDDVETRFSPIIDEILPSTFVMRFSAFEQLLD